MTSQNPSTNESLQHSLLGIHHVTAIAGDPQTNLDFYGGILGLGLVKKTVNFDDPQTYHLYYGDPEGSPGSILTFFPWPGARRGVLGSGQTEQVALAVPRNSLDLWARRLTAHGVDFEERHELGDDLLRFRDPDGLDLALVGTLDAVSDLPSSGTVLGSAAIQGIDHVTLAYDRPRKSLDLLTRLMGFQTVLEDGDLQQLEVGPGGPTARLQIRHTTGAGRGRIAAGSVHHVAFRVADDDAQAWWQRHLAESFHRTTQVMDRNYFRSVYFREPGGVLFELATDDPGFAVDEAPEHLGESLMLPDNLEPLRDKIEAVLPPLTPKDSSRSPSISEMEP